MMPTIARRCLSAVATVGAATAVTFAVGGAAQATTGGYVALGDSYSSGVGAGDYTSSSGSCDQSTNAYGQLWANANSPSSFSFEACSGATTSDSGLAATERVHRPGPAAPPGVAGQDGPVVHRPCGRAAPPDRANCGLAGRGGRPA